ncbi:MAG: LysR substrate-binding domain-containing protein [Pusillimonas sp.]
MLKIYRILWARIMNFRQLEAFQAVMKTSSASLAAELLQLTQPAISRSLQELEKSIGFALFDRVRGRLVPTAEGQLFYRDVSESFIGLDSLRSSAARIRDFGSGEIRLASLSALGQTLVPRALGLFYKQHPDIAITLEIMSSSAVRDRVATGQFDLGLAADEIDTTGVDHQTFATPRAVCAVPASHPLAARDAIHVSDLHGEPFIALAPEDTTRRRLDAMLKDSGVQPRVVVETPHSATVCALAAEGIGIGIINPYGIAVTPDPRVQIKPFSPALHFKALLVFRPDMQKSRIIQALVKTLLKARLS